MVPSPAFRLRRRGTWALSEPSAVLLWQLGMAWSSIAALVDASTGRRIVLSWFVLAGPVCVLFTGRWLRTAVAGAWATGLVVVLGIPDGIWGTHLEGFLIGLAVLVAVGSTLALVITIRSALWLTVTAFLAAGCGTPAAAPSRSLAVPSARPVSCRQQYEAWERRPASAGDNMQAAVNAVQVAEKSGNAAAVRSTLKRLMPAALAAAQFPPPRCADPDGLYGEYVTTVYEAGYNALSARGISNLVKAAAPLEGLKAIDSQLASAVNRSMAKNV
jgi:hypothetical protein